MLATSTTSWMSRELAKASSAPQVSPARPVDWSALPDSLLVGACLARDNDAFAELIRRYERPLLKMARRLVVNDDDARDATQQALMHAYLALPTSRPDLAVRPWLFRILHNQCFDRLRRKDAIPFSRLRASPEEEADGLPLDAPDASPLPDEVAEQTDLRSTVEQAVATLPPRYRPVVTMRYAEEMSFAEIAARLNVAEPTARTLFQRAKAMLRQTLAAQRTLTEPASGPSSLARLDAGDDDAIADDLSRGVRPRREARTTKLFAWNARV